MMKPKPRVGDWVEVRSKSEILATLDESGELDGMPFMPEMFAFCGRQFQVYKRAHKTCDTVFPIRGRRVAETLHLETRCSGSAHNGCQAGCLIFWKEAWLKPVKGSTPQNEAELRSALCTAAHVEAAVQRPDPEGGSPTYKCQATRLPYATSDLAWWDVRQYVEDYSSGNANVSQLVGAACYSIYHSVSQAGLGLGRPMRQFYDRFHRLWGGTPFPHRSGAIPQGQPTPVAQLNLQPGELVRIKSQADILQTVDVTNRNRGMYWDAEEVPYCGQTFRVLKRVTKIINEQTGRMQEMKTPSVILDSVVCQGRYSRCRVLCPRSIYPFWREIWLERVQETGVNSSVAVTQPTQDQSLCGQ